MKVVAVAREGCEWWVAFSPVACAAIVFLPGSFAHGTVVRLRTTMFDSVCGLCLLAVTVGNDVAYK